MAVIEIPDDWLEATGLSVDEAKDYLLIGYPLLKEFFLLDMGSTFILTPPNSIIGFGRVILKGIDGPVTESQSEDLKAIINSGEIMLEQLTLFSDVVSSVYGHHSIYLSDIDINETILSIVKYTTRKYEFEVDYDFPDTIVTIHSDGILIRRLLSAILKIAQRIHPTNKGKISISTQQTNSQIKIKVATVQDAEYPFELSSKNPIAFIAHSLVKELHGDLQITQEDNEWQITTSLPINYT